MSLNITASVTNETKQAGDVVTMVFHNGKLFTGAEGGKLMVYNNDLSLHKEIQAQYNTVNCMCIFNGNLVTTGNDGLLKIWDVKTLELKQTLTGHDNEVRKLTPTATRLYSGDMSGKVKIWGLDGTGQFTLSCVEEVWDIAVAGNICFTVRDKDVTVTDIMFRDTGESSNEGETKFVVMSSFEGRPPLALAGDTLCHCDRPGTVIHLRANEAGDTDLGKLEGHTKIITSMVTRGNLLYSAGYDNTVKAWDVSAKKLVATGTTVNSVVHSLAVGEDGSVFAGLDNGFIVKMVKQ